MFTARNRQNPFAKRRREQAEAEQQAAEQVVPVAVPVDLNPDSAEYTQAPDISTYETGGIVELPAEIDEDSPTPPLPDAEDAEREAPAVIEISADTQAKIDAVLNHTVPPVADAPTTSDELIASITDPGPAPIAEPETPPESDAKRGRGRPRPQETIERDNAVYELLKAADAVEGVSKEALALSLGEKEQQVYSSLRQLTKEWRAETRYVKGHGYRWFALQAD